MLFSRHLLLYVVAGFFLSAVNATQTLDTATEMYLYAWTLVMSNITRNSMWYVPDNLMLPLPVFPNPNVTAIVKPNVDTLYDCGWINHDEAPELTLTVPDTTDGLYYLFPAMDAWTNVIESPGWRTTGKGEIKVLIRGPNVQPSANDSQYDMIMESPTTMVYLLGRTNVADQNNLQPTQEQLFAYRLKPNDWSPPDNNHNSSQRSNDERERDEREDSNTNPVEEIFALSPEAFFNSFAALMISNPPLLPQDQDIVFKMADQYNLKAGTSWDFSSLTQTQQNELSLGLSKGIDMMYSYPVKRVNGWTMPDIMTGQYGTDYYLRAYIGLVLYAASLPYDTVYFETEIFEGGGKKYEVLYSAESLPPTNEFWSMTMYTEAGYLVPNENNMYSISSQQDLKYRHDGSLHITISIKEPPAASNDSEVTNWLPAPQDGENFQMTLRVFWPGDAILEGVWEPPLVTNHD